jgi:hypothetical protein
MPNFSTLSDQITVFKNKVDALTASGALDANALLLLAEALSVIGTALGVNDIVAATADAITKVEAAGTSTIATVNGTANGTAVTNLQSSYTTLNNAYTNLQPRVTSLEATNSSQESAIATASALAGLGGWNAWITHTSGNKQLVPNDRIFVIPAANMTLTLPITPSIGQAVRIVDAAGTAGTTNFTIARNGQPIMGTAQDMTVNTNSARLHLVYVDSTRGWRLV